jgi:hypothetical protein
MIYNTPRVHSRLGPSSQAPVFFIVASLLIDEIMCNQTMWHIAHTKPRANFFCNYMCKYSIEVQK